MHKYLPRMANEFIVNFTFLCFSKSSLAEVDALSDVHGASLIIGFPTLHLA